MQQLGDIAGKAAGFTDAGCRAKGAMSLLLTAAFSQDGGRK